MPSSEPSAPQARLTALREAIPLTLAELTPDPQSPWADDALHRASLATSLTTRVRHNTDPLVLSVTGGWGSGKTFFLTRWKLHLDQSNIPAFYYNAWNDDFSTDPLIPILHGLASLKPTDDAAADALIKRLRHSAIPLLITNASNLLKTRYGIDTSTLSETSSDDFLSSYRALTDHREELKSALVDWTEAVLPPSGSAVCIVDELDRCRPTYAIELLERVKHIFNIPRLVFVLGINPVELANSVKHVYGDIDSRGYLRRFFDAEFHLPRADTDTYCKFLATRSGLEEYFERQSAIFRQTGQNPPRDFAPVYDFLGKVSPLLKLSLRQIDRCFGMMAIVAKNLPDRFMLNPYLLGTLLALRSHNADFYLEFVSGTKTGAQVMRQVEEWIGDKRPPEMQFMLDMMEISLYATHLRDMYTRTDQTDTDSPIEQLELIARGQPANRSHLLAESTLSAGPQKAKRLLELYTRLRSPVGHIAGSSEYLKVLADLINMTPTTTAA